LGASVGLGGKLNFFILGLLRKLNPGSFVQLAMASTQESGVKITDKQHKITLIDIFYILPGGA